MDWIDVRGPVKADTVYANGQLVAKDVSFTLPALKMMTATIKAMGDMSVPIVGQMEDMELSITKIGIDMGLSRMNKLEANDFEFRWVQSVIKSDGSVADEGCKAFVRTLPSGLPEIGVEVGNTTESDNTYYATRMQLYVAGEEVYLIDRLAQIMRVNGKDYMKDITDML